MVTLFHNELHGTVLREGESYLRPRNRGRIEFSDVKKVCEPVLGIDKQRVSQNSWYSWPRWREPCRFYFASVKFHTKPLTKAILRVRLGNSSFSLRANRARSQTQQPSAKGSVGFIDRNTWTTARIFSRKGNAVARSFVSSRLALRESVSDKVLKLSARRLIPFNISIISSNRENDCALYNPVGFPAKSARFSRCLVYSEYCQFASYAVSHEYGATQQHPWADETGRSTVLSGTWTRSMEYARHRWLRNGALGMVRLLFIVLLHVVRIWQTYRNDGSWRRPMVSRERGERIIPPPSKSPTYLSI